MSKHTTPSLILALVTISLIAGVVLTIYLISGHIGLASVSQKKTNKTEDKKEKRPVALYAFTEPEGLEARTVRRARSARYNNRYPVPFESLPSDTTSLTTDSEWWLDLSPLPVDKSNAVVVGKVLSADAYVSEDKTGAYSEFTIRIDQVLLGNERKPIIPGDSITVDREGADVKLPSGRLIYTGISNQGTLQMDQQYLLFLKYFEQGDSYQVLTGYRLDNDLVLPLDRVEVFNRYRGVKRASLLNAVRNSIKNMQRRRGADQ